MRLLFRIVYSFLIVCLIIISSNGQTYNFSNFSVDKGLVQSQVISLGQDAHDALWIATYGGVSVYDGTAFKNYSKSDGLLNNIITQVYWSSKKMMWIVSNLGITSFDGVVFTNYKFPTTKIGASPICKMVEDKNGVIWVINNGVLYQFINNEFQKKSDQENIYLDIERLGETVYLSSFQNGLQKLNSNAEVSTVWEVNHKSSNQFILKILAEDSTDLLCLIENRIIKYNVKSGIAQPLTAIDQLKNSSQIHDYFKDSRGVIWVAMNDGGIWMYDNQWHYINHKSGFTNEIVLNIFEDNQQNIWFGTNGSGIFRYAPTPFTFFNKQTYFDAATIMSIGGDSKDNIYIGTTGKGIYTIIDDVPQLLPNTQQYAGVNTFGKWKEGLLFSDNHNALLYLNNKQIKSAVTGFSSPFTQHFYLHGRDSNLFTCGLYGFLQINKNGVVPHPLKISVNSFHFIDSVNVVLSTLNAAYLYNVSTRLLDTVPIIEDSYVLSAANNGEILYLATDDKGVICYNLKTKKYFAIGKNEGLSCNYVYSLLVDYQGQLWVGTGCGIDKIVFNKDQYSLTNYGKQEGMTGIENTNHAIFEDAQHNIWFGTNKGLYKYSPANEHLNVPKRNLLIQNVKLFSRDINYKDFATDRLPFSGIPKHPIFAPSQNHLTFYFKTIALAGSHNSRYRYQLKGIESQPVETDQNSVVYANLAPGKYEFIVWSQLENGIWDEQPTVYSFEIQDYFYNTLWFKISIAFLILAGYFVIKLYQARSKQRKLEWEERLRNDEQDKIRQRTAEDFHDELGNKLTRINLLSTIAINKIDQHSDASLKGVVQQIQQNITSLYKGSKDIIWSLQPQSDYLSEIFERVRTNAIELLDGANIDFHYDLHLVEKAIGIVNVETQKLNPEAGRNIIMIFKEGVNNIIKHAAAQNVYLEITVKEEAFLMHLKDDGLGIDVSSIQFGNGIKNMQRRADRIRATFHFGKNENGSYIEIIVPLVL